MMLLCYYNVISYGLEISTCYHSNLHKTDTAYMHKDDLLNDQS
jgi:hypothetical protein